jgi:hypothetical protein
VAAPATPALRAFVRDTLGCTCPEAVFDAVAVSDLVVDGQAAGTRLVIGDRLLVYLVEREVPTAAIGVLAAAGSADRDRHGLNRFRLVIDLPDGEMPLALEDVFTAAVARDAKSHLHCVRREGIAAALGRSATKKGAGTASPSSRRDTDAAGTVGDSSPTLPPTP